MGNILDLRSLQRQLAQIKSLGHTTHTFDLYGVEIRMEPLTPAQELEVQFLAAEVNRQSVQGKLSDELPRELAPLRGLLQEVADRKLNAGDATARITDMLQRAVSLAANISAKDRASQMEYIDATRYDILSRAISRLGEIDFSGISMVDTGEPISENNPETIKMGKELYLRKLLEEWPRTTLDRVYSEYTDMLTQMEKTAGSKIDHKIEDYESEVLRLKGELAAAQEKLQESKVAPQDEKAELRRELNAAPIQLGPQTIPNKGAPPPQRRAIPVEPPAPSRALSQPNPDIPAATASDEDLQAEIDRLVKQREAMLRARSERGATQERVIHDLRREVPGVPSHQRGLVSDRTVTARRDLSQVTLNPEIDPSKSGVNPQFTKQQKHRGRIK